MSKNLKDNSKKSIQLQFLGTGNAGSTEFGNSSAALTLPSGKIMVLDYGFTAHQAFLCRYKRMPDAVYITHLHLDHVGGLQSLFYSNFFSGNPPIKLFVHAELVPKLQSIHACFTNLIAEGAVNFFDAFQLIPVNEGFWYEGLYFDVFEGRHHAPKFSFGIALRGRFVFTGDTKPIPEALNMYGAQGEVIFHDLSIRKQPSHTYLDELDAYGDERREQMVFYHLHSESDRDLLRQRNIKFASEEQIYIL